jgi:hypothetical protein
MLLRRSLAVLALLASSAIACNERQSAPPGDSPPAASSGKPAPPASDTEGIPCTSAADCRVPCGPCTPGTVIPKNAQTIECFRDPCIHKSAVCNAQHVCIVGPGTEKDPQVWGIKPDH